MTRTLTAQPRILISPDKFKGTLSAPRAAAAIEAGIRRVLPNADIRLLPIADGGEGTVDAVLVAGARAHTATVGDPLGRPVQATWAALGSTAVVEISAASGLAHVLPTDDTALRSDTFGTGELIRQALENGAETIVVGLGGSASTDGGTGILRALGVRFLDQHGQLLTPGGGQLDRLHSVDLSGLHPRALTTPFVLCCDVSSPLLGPSGAANVFGPQKGAGPATIQRLEAGLATLAEVLSAATGRDAAVLSWGGAAGGSAAGLHAALGATFRQGIDEVAELLDFETQLEWADLLVVGEGSLDQQSLAGKAPIGLAQRAQRQGVPAIAVCGRLEVPAGDLLDHGIHAVASATDVALSTAQALRDPAKWAAAAAEQAVRSFLAKADVLTRNGEPEPVPATAS
jgi:glycerate 2-kinase